MSKVLIQPSFEYNHGKEELCKLLVNNRSWKYPVLVEDKYRYINIKIIGPKKNLIAYETTIKMLSVHADSEPDTEYSSRGSSYQLSGIDLRPSKQEKCGFKDHSEYSYFTFFREKKTSHSIDYRRSNPKYGDIEALGDQELLPKYLMRHAPIFTIFTIVAMTSLLVASILDEGDIVSWKDNPWIGAGNRTLIDNGAKYFPEMNNHNEYWRLVLASKFYSMGLICVGLIRSLGSNV